MELMTFTVSKIIVKHGPQESGPLRPHIYVCFLELAMPGGQPSVRSSNAQRLDMLSDVEDTPAAPSPAIDADAALLPQGRATTCIVRTKDRAYRIL